MSTSRALIPSEATLSDLLAYVGQPETLELIENVSEYHISLLDRVQSNAKRLSKYKEICVLFDFDVISSYLGLPGRSLSDRAAVVRFLAQSPLRFGFPAGAFFELLDFISRQSRRHVTETSPADNLSRKETTERVARAAGVDTIPGASSQSALILSRRENYLRRVVDLIEHERFVGVRGRFVPYHLDGWRDLIGSKRTGTRNKLRNYRDALNIATAALDVIASLRSDRRAVRSNEGYILVTQTALVSNLLTQNIPQLPVRQRIAGCFGGDIFQRHRQYPVLEPQHIAYLDAMRAGKTSAEMQRAAVRIDDLFANFTALRTIVRDFKQGWAMVDEVIEADRLQELRRRALEPLREAQLIGVEKTLGEIAARFPRKRRIELTRIEDARQTVHADILISRSAEGKEESPAERKMRAALSIGKLLEKIIFLCSKKGLLQYKAHILDRSPLDDSRKVQIVQIPEDGNTIIDGEFFGGKGQHTYVLRWPVSCTDVELIQGVVAAFPGASLFGREKRTTSVIVRLEGFDDPRRDSGIVYETNLGEYWQAGNSGDFEWSHATVRFVQQEVFTSGYLKSPPDDVKREGFSPYRLVLNGSSCKILFDLQPPVDTGQRMLSVISRWNISKAIALLYINTSPRFSIESTLTEAVDDLLDEFPRSK